MIQKQETENWFLNSKKEHKPVFSELNVLLKALDRFFSIENLPILKEDLTIRNFYDELIAVRDVIFRILSILEVVIPETKKNSFWFKKFAESKFLTDYSRDLFKQELYKQDTPEKGLYLLYDSLINIKVIIIDLLKSEKISYLSYKNIGDLISKEIRENIFFNPFVMDINPEFDRIENKELTVIVTSIKDKEIKRYVSFIYLYLFRFLRYLSHIDIKSYQTIVLHSSLIILIMIRSELSMFYNYIKKTSDSIKDDALKMILKSLSYQFSMELKRIYIQELKEILLLKKAPQHFRGKIKNSHGILKNLIEQSIVQIAQFFKPDVQGEDIFESFTTKYQNSLKLREDIFVLHRFLSLLEENTAIPSKGYFILESFKNYMRYFESFTFKLLRYDDYDEFAIFFHDSLALKESALSKSLENIHNFKIFLETTLRHISNRAELHGIPIDIKSAEHLLQKYL